MSERNAQFVGSIPEFYDRHLGPVLFEPYARDLADRLELNPDVRLLELACGTGILTRRLRERLPASGQLIATDLNEPMLAYARGRLGKHPRVEWHQADATELHFSAGSFDVVVCQFGLMFFPDKPRAAREVRRVLRQGGLFAFNVWDTLAQNPLARIAHETIGGFFPTDPPDFYLVPFSYADPGEITRLLSEAGFGEVELNYLPLEARSESAEHVAAGLVQGNPVGAAIRERGGSVDTVTAAVAEALRREAGSGPIRFNMQALVVTAR